MVRHSLLCFAMMTALACVARGQVAISYSPTTLEPGVPTDLTMTLTDTSGDVGAFTGIILTFDLSDGLTLNSFSWIPDEMADPNLWITITNLDGVPDDARPQVQAAAFAFGLPVDPNGSVDVAVLNVTAATSAAGTAQAITAIPDDSDTAITDTNFAELQIDSGAAFPVTVNEAGDGDGGSPGNGGGGGANPPDADPGDMPDGGDGGDGDTPQNDVPDATDGGTDQTPDTGGTTNADADPGDDNPEPAADGDITVDDTPDAGNPDDEIAGGGDGVGPVDIAGDTPADEPADDTPPSTTGTMPICGAGMIGPGLFTFALLSVMKLHRRRRW